MSYDNSTLSSGTARQSAANSAFANGAGAGLATLPHRDPASAAAFAIGEFDISSVPSLPNVPGGTKSMMAAAVARISGVDLTDEGLIIVGPMQLDNPLAADLDDVAFAGLRAFLDLAGKIGLDGAPVSWSYTGPVTVGTALNDAGVDRQVAYPLAVDVVRHHLVDVSAAIGEVLPTSPQLVMLDEPALARLMFPDFPIAPDHAIDLMSNAMAAVSMSAIVGVHCDEPCDVATMLASGPGVISLPVRADLVDWAGYLQRFLHDGGVIAWGAIPTTGPVSPSAERHWRDLSDLWCELVRRDCDPVALRRQSMVTPAGGLDGHSVSGARKIARLAAAVGRRVKDQANATRFALGA